MASDDLFESINSNTHTLDYIVGDSAEELKALLKKITLPTNIVSIYAVGSKHFAWINTAAKIKKVKKEIK